jgi:hypothetical protein
MDVDSITKKISLTQANAKISNDNLNKQKLSNAYGNHEKFLINHLKKAFNEAGYAITTVTEYFLLSEYFGTPSIGSWDKSKYEEITKNPMVIVDGNSNAIISDFS